MRSGHGGGHGGAAQRSRGGRGGRGGGGGRGTPMVRAPPVITPPPMTEAAMAARIDHIQEARLPHLMGEMISFIWLV